MFQVRIHVWKKVVCLNVNDIIAKLVKLLFIWAIKLQKGKKELENGRC